MAPVALLPGNLLILEVVHGPPTCFVERIRPMLADPVSYGLDLHATRLRHPLPVSLTDVARNASSDRRPMLRWSVLAKVRAIADPSLMSSLCSRLSFLIQAAQSGTGSMRRLPGTIRR